MPSDMNNNTSTLLDELTYGVNQLSNLPEFMASFIQYSQLAESPDTMTAVLFGQDGKEYELRYAHSHISTNGGVQIEVYFVVEGDPASSVWQLISNGLLGAQMRAQVREFNCVVGTSVVMKTIETCSAEEAKFVDFLDARVRQRPTVPQDNSRTVTLQYDLGLSDKEVEKYVLLYHFASGSRRGMCVRPVNSSAFFFIHLARPYVPGLPKKSPLVDDDSFVNAVGLSSMYWFINLHR